MGFLKDAEMPFHLIDNSVPILFRVPRLLLAPRLLQVQVAVVRVAVRVKRIIAFASLVLGLGIVSLGQGMDLSLTGSSTIAPLALEIAKAYENQHKDVRIFVQTGGSTRGIQDARNELADLGMVSRSLKPQEQDLQAYTIALDGICFIVHSSNPVSELSREDIIDIYTGRIDNWQAVGGLNKPIVVVHKAEGRSTLELFLKFFKLQNRSINADVIIGDNQQGLKTVLGNPNAIAYTSIGAAEYEASLGALLKRLPLNGIEATSENVKNGSYELSRPLNLVVKSNKNPAIDSFIQFAQSQAVRNIVEQQYLVMPDATDER
jgi:phosphate transport system substrate-binding protein